MKKLDSRDQHRQLLEVVNLKKYFYVRKSFRKPQTLKAVDGISFGLNPQETMGIVGESGCGKSTLGKTILRLYPPTSGDIFFNGVNLCDLSGEEMRRIRRQMQIIFQDPFSSLNPRMKIGKVLDQILHSHGFIDSTERTTRSHEIMEKVGLTAADLKKFPHEFSGGQRQRIAIARALILNPKFIVADEPSSSLDMSIQAQILNLMKSLQEEFRISYLFITHNLSAARFVCNRIAVMYLGKIVELASCTTLFRNPGHPYTIALLALCPTPDPDKRIEKVPLTGDVPSPVNLPRGCRFHPRCSYVENLCKEAEPSLVETEPDHFIACHYHQGKETQYESNGDCSDKRRRET
jgi:oligopeptide/dipeptide ABC transporter ATP-binding protein